MNSIISQSLLIFITVTLTTSAEKLGHLKPLGKQGSTYTIEEVNGFPTPEDFFLHYAGGKKPLLIKNAVKESTAWKLWTDEYLVDSAEEGPSGSTKMIFAKKGETLIVNQDFLQFKTLVKDVLGNDSSFYYVDDLLGFMKTDLEIHKTLQCNSLLRGGLNMHMSWISFRAGTGLHWHDTDSIDCIFRGRKEAVFINPHKYSDMRSQISAASPRINPQEVDLNAHPFLEKVEFGLANQEAGDCLYIPVDWIHHVDMFEHALAVDTFWKPQAITKETCEFDNVALKTFADVTLGDMATRIYKETTRIIEEMEHIGIETLSVFYKILANKNSEILENTEFKYFLSEIFQLLDKNKDGFITRYDFGIKLKLNDVNRANEFLTAYNNFIHDFRSRATDLEDPMPLYLYRDRPKTFTEENSFAFPIVGKKFNQKKEQENIKNEENNEKKEVIKDEEESQRDEL